jgi:hypothetical protein
MLNQYPTREDTMHEELQPSVAWIERCARRLQLRHMVAPPDALEIASVMHEAYGAHACPERAAEELFIAARLH